MLKLMNYTVVLTYVSLLSAVLGIVISLNGPGHPYMGVYFLMLSGLCDAFDGRVARRKPNRTEVEKEFGVQIDSLSDLVAFGVLPVCIGHAMLRVSLRWLNKPLWTEGSWFEIAYPILFNLIMCFYVYAAMTRLAYFNVQEELEKRENPNYTRKVYTGLPVTAAALIFPTVMLIQYLTPTIDLAPLYIITMLVTGICFISSKLQIKKVGFKGIMIMVLIGTIELLLFILFNSFLPLPHH